MQSCLPAGLSQWGFFSGKHAQDGSLYSSVIVGSLLYIGRLVVFVSGVCPQTGHSWFAQDG